MLREARVVISAWRMKFKQVRPHRSLGMTTPEEFAFGLASARGQTTQSAPYALRSPVFARKQIDKQVGAPINETVSSHFERTINWKITTRRVIQISLSFATNLF
ncbi:MAG: integrase core domain-containing protein [Akkermansiaceae bacterium]